MTARSTTLTTWLINNSPVNGNDAALTASDLAGSQPPKTKFLFTVDFKFRDSSDANRRISANKGSISMELIQYDLKAASRPNITFQQEDVNYYGYRTKVLTKTNFGTVKLTFYEDTLNRANDLVWQYIKAVSPIARRPATQVSITDTGGDAVSGGLDIKDANTIGALAHADGPIARMSVYHHYIEYTPNNNFKKKTTVYTYTNPKIESVEFDELDMSNSDVSTITVTFTADYINVEHIDYAETGNQQPQPTRTPPRVTGPVP